MFIFTYHTTEREAYHKDYPHPGLWWCPDWCFNSKNLANDKKHSKLLNRHKKKRKNCSSCKYTKDDKTPLNGDTIIMLIWKAGRSNGLFQIKNVFIISQSTMFPTWTYTSVNKVYLFSKNVFFSVYLLSSLSILTTVKWISCNMESC